MNHHEYDYLFDGLKGEELRIARSKLVEGHEYEYLTLQGQTKAELANNLRATMWWFDDFIASCTTSYPLIEASGTALPRVTAKLDATAHFTDALDSPEKVDVGNIVTLQFVKLRKGPLGWRSSEQLRAPALRERFDLVGFFLDQYTPIEVLYIFEEGYLEETLGATEALSVLLAEVAHAVDDGKPFAMFVESRIGGWPEDSMIFSHAKDQTMPGFTRITIQDEGLSFLYVKPDSLL